jgi:hypothetical protein
LARGLESLRGDGGVSEDAVAHSYLRRAFERLEWQLRAARPVRSEFFGAWRRATGSHEVGVHPWPRAPSLPRPLCKSNTISEGDFWCDGVERPYAPVLVRSIGQGDRTGALRSGRDPLKRQRTPKAPVPPVVRIEGDVGKIRDQVVNLAPIRFCAVGFFRALARFVRVGFFVFLARSLRLGFFVAMARSQGVGFSVFLARSLEYGFLGGRWLARIQWVSWINWLARPVWVSSSAWRAPLIWVSSKRWLAPTVWVSSEQWLA